MSHSSTWIPIQELQAFVKETACNALPPISWIAQGKTLPQYTSAAILKENAAAAMLRILPTKLHKDYSVNNTKMTGVGPRDSFLLLLSLVLVKSHWCICCHFRNSGLQVVSLPWSRLASFSYNFHLISPTNLTLPRVLTGRFLGKYLCE